MLIGVSFLFKNIAEHVLRASELITKVNLSYDKDSNSVNLSIVVLPSEVKGLSARKS